MNERRGIYRWRGALGVWRCSKHPRSIFALLMTSGMVKHSRASFTSLCHVSLLMTVSTGRIAPNRHRIPVDNCRWKMGWIRPASGSAEPPGSAEPWPGPISPQFGRWIPRLSLNSEHGILGLFDHVISEFSAYLSTSLILDSVRLIDRLLYCRFSSILIASPAWLVFQAYSGIEYFIYGIMHCKHS